MPQSQSFIPKQGEQSPRFRVETKPQHEQPQHREVEVPKERQPKAEVDRQEGGLEASIQTLKSKLVKPKGKKQKAIPQVRDEVTIRVEQIMQDGLEDAFLELSPIEQQEFKIKGEQTALEIRTLLRSTHVKVKKVFQLIVEWLKMLPGINRFYLMQEAKIKTDKLIAMKEHKR